MFESRLLIMITAMTLLVTAFAIALSWLVNRRIRGAHYWSLGYFLMTGGVVLQSFQTVLTPVLSIGLANLTLTCGIYYTYVGVSLFQGRMVRHHGGLLLLVAFIIAVHLAVGLGEEGFYARTLVISGLIGIIAFMVGYGFLRKEGRGDRLAYRINAVVYFLLGIAFSMRAVSVMVIPSQASVIENTPFNHYTYIMATVFNVLIAFSYMLTLYSKNGFLVQRVADTDLQTGLLNRRGLGRHADLLMKRVVALGGNVTAIFFEVEVCEPTGVGGSEVISKRIMTHFSEKLLRCFQSDDLIGRVGEKLFVVVIPYQAAAKANEDAEYLKRTFEEEGTECYGMTVRSRIDFVSIESARVLSTFEELLLRAGRLRKMASLGAVGGG